MRQVVFTGFGAVHAFGRGPVSLWQALLAGQSAVRRPHRLRSVLPHGAVCAEIGHPEGPAAAIPCPPHHLDRLHAWAMDAAHQAWEQAFPSSLPDPSRRGLATAMGWVMPPHPPPRPFYHPAERELAGTFSLRGINLSSLSACIASTQLLADAALAVALGDADLILCVSADSRITPRGFLSYQALQATTWAAEEEEVARACRPFDRRRNGFVVGEGAAACVIESAEHAHRRGATILAHLSGWAANSDGFRLTDPDPSGQQAAACIREALTHARTQITNAVTHPALLSLHGTGTRANDAAEATALTLALPQAAHIPAFSIKHSIGHLSMAAGLMETIITCLALQHRVAPPNPHSDQLDPAIPPLAVSSRPTPFQTEGPALKVSFGFGGLNAALVLERGHEFSRARL